MIIAPPPARLTAEVVAAAPGLFRRLLDLSPVAAALGIDRATLRGWLRAGADVQRRVEDAGEAVELTGDEALLVWLLQTSRKALAEAEADLLAIVRAGGPDWQLAAVCLAHRWPSRWGRQRTERSVPRTVATRFRRLLAGARKRGLPLTTADTLNALAREG